MVTRLINIERKEDGTLELKWEKTVNENTQIEGG